MTAPPAQGQVPGREGSNEQATRGTPPALSPSFVDPTRLDVVDSTNCYLADQAAEGAPEGSSVLADRQTAGRGRLQRSWVDVPGGSLLCSMLFRPVMEIDRWFLVSMLVALAGLDACADGAGVDARCKWPNDLVVDGRKVGGILAEVVPPRAPRSGTGAGLVVGIGLNCNWGEAWDAAPLGPTVLATSLDRVAGRPVDREAVASRLLERVAQRYAALTGPAGSPAGSSKAARLRTASLPASAPPNAERSLLAEYRRKLDTVGRVVRVEVADEVFTGRALDVDDAGRLLVDVGMCTRAVEAGDVVQVR